MAKDKSEKKPVTRNYRLKSTSAVDALVDVHFFNRFSLEIVDGFHVLFLGAVINGEVLSAHVIAMAALDLQQAYVHSKEYISALNTVSQEPPKEWDRPRTKLPVYVSNVIQCSFSGAVGEIGFSNYTIHDLAMVRKGTLNELYSRRNLVVRSSIELHRQLVGNLFKGME